MFYTHTRHIKIRIAIVKSEQTHHNLAFRTISTEFLLEPNLAVLIQSGKIRTLAPQAPPYSALTSWGYQDPRLKGHDFPRDCCLY